MAAILRVRDSNGNVTEIPAVVSLAGETITKFERTSGDGSPGTTDTYTMTTSLGKKYTIEIHHGKDGGLGEADVRTIVEDEMDKLTASDVTCADGKSVEEQLAKLWQDNASMANELDAVEADKVSKVGGTMTGDLEVASDNHPKFIMTDAAQGVRAWIERDPSTGVNIACSNADGDVAVLHLSDVDEGLADALTVTRRTVDGASEVFAVYHAGNKPNAVDVAAVSIGTDRIEIPTGADLDSYTTVGGYKCPLNVDAMSLVNCPVQVAFTMDVMAANGNWRAIDVSDHSYLIQKLHTLNGDEYYRTVQSNGTGAVICGPWHCYYNTNHPPTPAEIGAQVSLGVTTLTELRDALKAIWEV